MQRPIQIATLEPEIAAPWTWSACVAGTDPAMPAMARALASVRLAPARD